MAPADDGEMIRPVSRVASEQRPDVHREMRMPVKNMVPISGMLIISA